jgi:hypothetical protein
MPFGDLFVEPFRPLVHAPGPYASPPGRGDEDGCLNNATNSLYAFPGFQIGASAADTLLCRIHEGPPRVVPEGCEPAHDARGQGTPSAVAAGHVDLPAIRVRLNEPIDPGPLAVHPPSQRSPTVQLWRVGTVDGDPVPVTASEQVPTNRPLVVQSIEQAEVILVATGPLPPGTYLVNVLGLTDLPGNPLVTTDGPSPADGGYEAIDAAIAGVVPAGRRIYFRTIDLP